MVKDFDAFVDKYDPIYNVVVIDVAEKYVGGNDTPIQDLAPLGGHMFETFGAEFDYVKKQDLNKIWTVVEDDDGELKIVSGLHYVNRYGYLVTNNPVESDEVFIVN